MRLPNRLPDLPEGWSYDPGRLGALRQYVWVDHDEIGRTFCLDHINSVWHVEYEGNGWNKPFESFKGYESIQEAAQAVISIIITRGGELLRGTDDEHE